MDADFKNKRSIGSKSASETSAATATPNSISENDVDSICGMLMQLETGVQTGEIDQAGCGNGSILRITRDEKVVAATFGALFFVLVGDKDAKEKESAIKEVLSGGCLSKSPGDQYSGKDTDVNARDGRGRTPLMYALAEASAPIIELLLKCDRTDYLARDRSANTALMYASARGYDSVVRLFMDAFKRRYRKDSATLLDYLDAENDNGETAVTVALQNGHEDCAIALSEYLKDALEKEERRVTSLAYKMGLRGKSESRVQSAISLKETDHRPGALDNLAMAAGQDRKPNSPKRRRSSGSPSRKSDKLAVLSAVGTLMRRGRDVSRYYADEEDGLLESEEPKRSPEIQRSSSISQININLDLRLDHNFYRYHRAKGRSKEKSQRHRMARCEDQNLANETT